MIRNAHNLALNLCLASTLCTLLALAASTGCNSANSGRASISGKVTFDGQPLKSGEIVFEPQGTGRLGIAQIVDGAYQMPAQQGPTPGKYLVRITANRPTGKAVQPAADTSGRSSGVSYEQFIPAKYNEKSTTTIEIGVEPAAVHDFALTAS
ncbi:hypothetical protein [Lacipirellula parvula]|uniref:Carboxypeptidase regulatory-like domain-containing protein n=1 Tax=Lacipirellula parvula TaxID=2650471 RepID=A0A5K7X9C8_9BACT|nr:hypothetical protein [Lacipirellula parvula]BBO33148.1 hypothetical protein PLANPX_2760 [Lacipirellula parvula]